MFSPTGVCRFVASTVAALLALGITHSAAAADEENPSGFYIGAGLGQSTVKVDNLEGVGDVLEDLDSNATAWKLVIGWRSNPDIALETNSLDLSGPDGN